MKWRKADFWISDEYDDIDIEFVYRFLAEDSYWSLKIPKDRFLTSISNSLNFSLYSNDKQVGFARIISDYATMAYLGDVFIDKEFRGQDLGKWLMDTVMSHHTLKGLRRWMLATSDAHGLYEKYGFTRLAKPELFMEMHDRSVYR
ncbi:MAG: GNAT superfamily N-acetyltransferase [Arenicella sp.]|jgi:GNAT superfamily N-acetyltransferase